MRGLNWTLYLETFVNICSIRPNSIFQSKIYLNVTQSMYYSQTSTVCGGLWEFYLNNGEFSRKKNRSRRKLNYNCQCRGTWPSPFSHSEKFHTRKLNPNTFPSHNEILKKVYFHLYTHILYPHFSFDMNENRASIYYSEWKKNISNSKFDVS